MMAGTDEEFPRFTVLHLFLSYRDILVSRNAFTRCKWAA